MVHLEHTEAAEMRFLRSVKGYTRLDKIRNEVIKKELKISGIKDVKSKYKQNWINHLERMDNTRLPKYALNINLEEEEIVDDLRNDGNASMPEQVSRPKPWGKMMMISCGERGARIIEKHGRNKTYILLSHEQKIKLVCLFVCLFVCYVHNALRTLHLLRKWKVRDFCSYWGFCSSTWR